MSRPGPGGDASLRAGPDSPRASASTIEATSVAYTSSGALESFVSAGSTYSVARSADGRIASLTRGGVTFTITRDSVGRISEVAA